jgi:hypothetical protein
LSDNIANHINRENKKKLPAMKKPLETLKSINQDLSNANRQKSQLVYDVKKKDASNFFKKRNQPHQVNNVQPPIIIDKKTFARKEEVTSKWVK